MAEDASDVEAWKAKTSAFDRVQSVAEVASQPRSAAHIAEEAQVSEDTAREHLERLVDMSVLLKSEHEETVRYATDPLYPRLQTLLDLIDNNDRDELVQLKDSLQDKIRKWQNEYGVDTPEGLRNLSANTSTVAETRDILITARKWELACVERRGRYIDECAAVRTHRQFRSQRVRRRVLSRRRGPRNTGRRHRARRRRHLLRTASVRTIEDYLLDVPKEERAPAKTGK